MNDLSNAFRYVGHAFVARVTSWLLSHYSHSIPVTMKLIETKANAQAGMKEAWHEDWENI